MESNHIYCTNETDYNAPATFNNSFDNDTKTTLSNTNLKQTLNSTLSQQNRIQQSFKHVTCRHCHFSPLCLHNKSNDKDSKTKNTLSHFSPQDVPKRQFKKGQNLFVPGDKLEHFAIVREGAVKCFSLNNDGSEQITRFVLPGELLGLEAFGSGYQYSFAQAIEATQICLFSLPQLETHWHEDQAFQIHCMKLMSASLAKQNTISRLLNKTSADTRLATFLMDIVDNYNHRQLRSEEIRLPMPRADIGNYLSLALETISRAMSRLEKRGIIQVTGKQVKILDLEGLQALVPDNMAPADLNL